MAAATFSESLILSKVHPFQRESEGFGDDNHH